MCQVFISLNYYWVPILFFLKKLTIYFLFQNYQKKLSLTNCSGENFLFWSFFMKAPPSFAFTKGTWEFCFPPTIGSAPPKEIETVKSLLYRFSSKIYFCLKCLAFSTTILKPLFIFFSGLCVSFLWWGFCTFQRLLCPAISLRWKTNPATMLQWEVLATPTNFVLRARVFMLGLADDGLIFFIWSDLGSSLELMLMFRASFFFL